MEKVFIEKKISLLELIENEASSIEIYAEDHKIITKDVLEKLYLTGKNLMVKAKDYILTIEGKKIDNFYNELLTDVIFISNKEGSYFILNEGNELPGCITIEIKEKIAELEDGGKYMVESYKKLDYYFEKENTTEKLSVIMLTLQILLGIFTIIISILFLSGNLGNSSVVIVVPALTCCLLASVNLIIITIKKRENSF